MTAPDASKRLRSCFRLCVPPVGHIHHEVKLDCAFTPSDANVVSGSEDGMRPTNRLCMPLSRVQAKFLLESSFNILLASDQTTQLMSLSFLFCA